MYFPLMLQQPLGVERRMVQQDSDTYSETDNPLTKLKLHSPDWANENIRKLAEIFPNCVTETQGSDGTIKRAIDYDKPHL